MSLLEVRGLSAEIGLRDATVHAVDQVSLTVDEGETLGLVGESGCGKTMLGTSIIRLLPPGGRIVGGEVVLAGRDLVRLSAAEMRKVRGGEIGMVFQDPMTSLDPTQPVGRQIAESVRQHKGVSRKAALDRAGEVLALVGMPRPSERLDDYPHQLSGGLRQRVMIAMALANEPRLLIADEPTTALDVTIQAQILDLIDSLKDRLQMAVILITHDLGVIAERADRTYVMYAGRIVEHATTVQLFDQMRHPYTEALLASIPKMDQDARHRLYSIPGLPPELTLPFTSCRFAPRCQYAQSACREEDPQLGGPDPAHQFACFFPTQTSADDVRAIDELGGTEAAAAVTEPSRAAGGPRGSGGKDFPPGAGGVWRGSSPRGDAAAPDGERRFLPLLKLTGVSKEFPVTAGVLQRKTGSVKAVTDVSVEVRIGETFGLVGESGCGKTTIGRMMVALEKPTAGRVVFEGNDLGALTSKQVRKLRSDLQLVFQDPYASLDPRMRVGAILREPLAIQAVGTRAEQRLRVEELLDEVGLSRNAVERFPHEFSGGQRQRIGLARALALNPKLIVADEPVSALDVSIRSQILNLMKRLQADHSLTYLIISHDLSVVRYMADRVGVMYLGRLVEIGTVRDVYERTAHPYTSGLLASIPVPAPRHHRALGVGVKGELPSAIDPPSGCVFRTRCPRAQQICADEVPPVVSFGAEHLAACHFPLQSSAGLPTASVAADSGVAADAGADGAIAGN
ncbi:MAG TPA: ABC transporter ATP-binding protein [Streptosporangiaceae bacterium]|nr:ABC transporter ATP-binding protein [Streptosporangiaceae bacterium]